MTQNTKNTLNFKFYHHYLEMTFKYNVSFETLPPPVFFSEIDLFLKFCLHVVKYFLTIQE